ncbi:OmpA family protein [Nocardiopsis sp. CA-288880]|uniref:OmpA family protein n=1 Tax=Nocardiopsis sp. CA-288880 TaxID=3239995 RepID=UPI003D96BAB4
MSQIRRLSALLLAAAILLGIPYLLLWHLPWPELPDSWAVAAAHLRGWRLPPGVFTALLISVLWALWGLYTAGLAVETVARLRGLPRRLRPLGPLQVVAAAAVGTVALAPATAFADAVTTQDDHEADGEQDGDAPSAPEEAPSAQPVERVRTVSGFGVGSAELTEQMRDDLAPVVDMIDSYGDTETPVRITGHTDPTGTVQANQELSERRAQAVADHLDEALGEDAPEMTVDGVGSEQPREGGAAAQRRAEVTYTVVPQPTSLQSRVMAAAEAEEPAAAAGAGEAADAAEEDDPVEAAAAAAAEAAAEDGREVLVVEIPDGAVTGAVAFAGLAGGYLLGKRGVRMPSVNLSLPRLPRASRRLALTAGPPRPTPGEDIDERVTVELDHVPGLGITGPGAAGAARRLIVNALDRLDHNSVRVLLTEDDAARLVGDRGRDLLRAHPCEPVRMVGTMEEALSVLQHELHRIAEDREPRPASPLALVTAPGSEHETALSGLLLHGQHQGITAVILGRWPLGGSCVIEEDGLITETSPPLNPVFHCSWPGATAEEVMDAVRAYRHSSPAVEETEERVQSQEAAPAETVEEAGSFAEPFLGALGEQAVSASAESVETAEAAETAEVTESAETVATAQAVELTEPTETVESVESVGTPESTGTAVREKADRKAGKAAKAAKTRRAKEADVAEEGFWDVDVWNTDFWEGETRAARKADTARTGTEQADAVPSVSEPSAAAWYETPVTDEARHEAVPANTARSDRSAAEETAARPPLSEVSAPAEAVPEPSAARWSETALTDAERGGAVSADAAQPGVRSDRSAAEETAARPVPSELSVPAEAVPGPTAAVPPVSEEPEARKAASEPTVPEPAVAESTVPEPAVSGHADAARTDIASPAAGADRSAAPPSAEEEAAPEPSGSAQAVPEAPVSPEAVAEPSPAAGPVTSEPVQREAAPGEPVSAQRAPEASTAEEPAPVAAEPRRPSAEQFASELSPSGGSASRERAAEESVPEPAAPQGGAPAQSTPSEEPVAARPAPGRPSTGTVPSVVASPARAERPAQKKHTAPPRQEQAPEEEPAPLRKAAKRAVRSRRPRPDGGASTPAAPAAQTAQVRRSEPPAAPEQPARPERALARAQRAAKSGTARADGVTSRAERLERLKRAERKNATARAGAGAENPATDAEGGEPDEGKSSRPLLRKPKKAGRGRSWRPRENS